MAYSSRTSGGPAMVVGLTAIASGGAFVIFGSAREPFGTLNDIGVAATGALAAALTVRLSTRAASPTVVIAGVGAAIAAVGSWLVISRTTGWLLAGFVSTIGFALIGPSVSASRALASQHIGPQGLTTLGQVTGAIMTVGLIAATPVAMRVDDAATAPGWTWLAFSGWLGSFVLFPAWAIWLGRMPRGRRSAGTAMASPGGRP